MSSLTIDLSRCSSCGRDVVLDADQSLQIVITFAGETVRHGVVCPDCQTGPATGRGHAAPVEERPTP